MKQHRLYYAVTDAVPDRVGGEAIIAFFQGVWFVHPRLEARLISDTKAFGAEATMLFRCTDINLSAIITMPWPESRHS